MDSWFKPSDNRFRTQSEYEDPMDAQGESEGEPQEETAAVFPDSGGYTGLSASRPALVEPYPDALGAPPTPPASPIPSASPVAPELQGFPGISYPGAGTDAHRPITRVPSDQGSGWGKPTEAPPVAPEWGARAETAPAAPPTWEAPEESSEAAEPLWGRSAEPEPALDSVYDPAPAPDFDQDGHLDRDPESVSEVEREAEGSSVWEPRGAEQTPLSTAGYPGIAASAQVPLPPERPEDAEQVPSHNTWVSPGHDSWGTESADLEAPGTPEPDSWTDPRAWEDLPGPTFTEANENPLAPRPLNDPWSEPESARWVDPSPSYLEEDRHDDELSPGPGERSAEPYDELSAPSPAASPMGGDGFGGGSGNTWAFDRDDPRLPDVVRDAERRRRESVWEEPTFADHGAEPEGEAPERHSGPDTGELSAAVAGSDDPLAAIANMQSRAKAKENGEPEGSSHAEPFEQDESWDSSGPSWSRGAEGATQMFDASSLHEPTGYRGGAHGTAPRDELGFDGRGANGYEQPRGADQGFDAPAYDVRDHAAHEQAAPDADRYGVDDRGHDELGYYDRGLETDGDDGRPGTDAIAAGLPSDLGSDPTDGRHTQDRPDAWTDDRRDFDVEEPEGDTDEPEYDDGFTPADYGMTERPRPVRRRRDRITDDFPGFDDRPPGGEAGDSYPGYESVDFLADTEPGALQTLWLGVASLIPVLGVITALLALFITGPKAKKEIRESRGALDGLGMITMGTVFSVVGILVTVISIAIWLIL